MRSIILLSLLLLGACAPETTRVYTEKDNSIQVRVGATFAIKLPVQLSTGYAWELKELSDSSGVKLLNHEVLTVENQEEENGEDYDQFVFRCLRRGEYRVTFWYVRPWQKNKPGDDNVQIRKFVIEIP